MSKLKQCIFANKLNSDRRHFLMTKLVTIVLSCLQYVWWISGRPICIKNTSRVQSSAERIGPKERRLVMACFRYTISHTSINGRHTTTTLLSCLLFVRKSAQGSVQLCYRFLIVSTFICVHRARRKSDMKCGEITKHARLGCSIMAPPARHYISITFFSVYLYLS